MKGWGTVLIIAGILLATIAVIMGSTVEQEVPYNIGLSTLTRMQEMHNLPRAQQQLLTFMGGCTLFLGGLILSAAAQIERVLATPVREAAVPFVPPVERPVAPKLSPQELAEQEYEADRAREADRRFTTIVFGCVLAFAAILLGYSVLTRHAPVADATNAADLNLEQLADNLEAQAAEIDAATARDAR